VFFTISVLFSTYCSSYSNAPVERSEATAKFLEDLDVDVKSGEYKRLGRWYSEDILCNVVRFLKGIKGWENFDIDREWSPPALFQKRASCKDA
jgi:hypothetical protein